MSNKVLCVDDDPVILKGYRLSLGTRFAIDTAGDGPAGLTMLKNYGPYAVIVADMQLPGMNGIEFLAHAREEAPETVRFMLTGDTGQQTAIEAVNEGSILRFLTKPCAPGVFAKALEHGLEQYRLITAEAALLQDTLNGSVKLLMEVLAKADPQAFGLGQQLRDYLRAFSKSFKIEKGWEVE